MASISLIGASNIGYAHICSIVRTGNTFLGYYDIHNFHFESGDLIRNDWEDIKESVILPNTPKCYTSIEDMINDNPDVIIIASPTKTHLDYLKQLIPYKGKVLCEKPLGRITSLDKIRDRNYTLYGGYEWKLHPTLKWLNIKSVKEVHNNKPDWVNTFEDTCWDLAGHCISMLDMKVYTIKSIETLGDLHYKVNLKLSNANVFFKDVSIEFGYAENYNLTKDSPITIVNDNIILRWCDLFDWHLQEILFNDEVDSKIVIDSDLYINNVIKSIIDLGKVNFI